MVKYFCDRCGKEVEKPKYYSVEVHIDSVYSFSEYLCLNDNGNPIPTDSLLCPKCGRDFIKKYKDFMHPNLQYTDMKQEE